MTINGATRAAVLGAQQGRVMYPGVSRIEAP